MRSVWCDIPGPAEKPAAGRPDFLSNTFRRSISPYRPGRRHGCGHSGDQAFGRPGKKMGTEIADYAVDICNTYDVLTMGSWDVLTSRWMGSQICSIRSWRKAYMRLGSKMRRIPKYRAQSRGHCRINTSLPHCSEDSPLLKEL
jgi:hypothetical protein